MAKNIRAVVEEFYKSGLCKKMINSHILFIPEDISEELKKDFEQDVYLLLLEHKEKRRLTKLWNTNRKIFLGYVYSIIRNNLASELSPFYKTYGKYYSLKNQFYNVEKHPNT